MINGEWIDVNIPFWCRKGENFTDRGLNQSGTLIEIESGEQFLIGDINDVGGICNDCRAFPDRAVVKRYKIVWKRKED